MIKFRTIVASSGMALFLTAAATAGQDFNDVIAARQGQFYILDYNLKALEEMGSNKTPYERETAIKRAENIRMVTQLNQDANWLPGSDQPGVPRTQAQGVRANPEQFKASWLAMMKAAEQLEAVASHGPPVSLGPAAAELRKTCSSCHQFYRVGYRGQ